MILQIPGYMYAYDNSRLYLTLYGSSRTSVPMEDSAVGIEQRSDYPFDGRVRRGADAGKGDAVRDLHADPHVVFPRAVHARRSTPTRTRRTKRSKCA